MRFIKGFLGFAVLWLVPAYLFADYTVLLKSGGRITVKGYWEEKGMVKFHGLGGEIGIAVDQIQAIVRAGETARQGMVIAAIKSQVAGAAKEGLALGKLGSAVALTDERARDLRVEKDLRAETEKGYQGMHDAVTGAIKSRTDLHWLLTRGKTTPDPTLLETLEALNGRINDLMSRLKDAQYNPARRATGVVRMITSSPFAGQNMTIELSPTGVVRPGSVDALPFPVTPTVDAPLPKYSGSEAEISVLRGQLEQLYGERKRLIDVFKQEGLFSGSLPYEAFP